MQREGTGRKKNDTTRNAETTICEKLEARNKVLIRNTRRNQQQYKELRTAAKKLIRREKREFMNSKISEIQRSHYQNNFKKFYADIKFHSSAFQPRLNICRDINENVLEEEKDILQRWREHFQLTLNVDTPSEKEDQDNQVNDRTFSENVTDDFAPEIGEIIRKMKNGRAGGEDDIVIELIKLSKTELLIKEIQQLIASV